VLDISAAMKTRPLQLDRWANAFLGFFYPEVCQLCGLPRATPAEGFVCPKCASSAEIIQPPFCDRCGLPFAGVISQTFVCQNCRSTELHFCSARAAVVAKDKVLDAIHLYKYNRALCLEPFLAGLLARQAQPAISLNQWDLIVPVPLHPVKEREREFNQAERLSRCLSRAIGLPLETRAVYRVLPTRTQTLLTREERLENMRKAFEANTSSDICGKRIILVDDVFTTGATASACAGALKQGGAAEVCVWTVARGV
jgi:competence protein ComFC